MRLLISNETGVDLWTTYPKTLLNANPMIEFRIYLYEILPPEGWRIKQLRQPPFCAGLDLPEIPEAGDLALSLEAPKDFSMEAEYGN